MVSYISEGVKVSVETFYQQDYSNPLQSEFMFAYKVTIENHNPFRIKILGRYWHIFDSNGDYREVEADGIVGVQPTILTGTEYEYVSGCNLNTEMGSMSGAYHVENVSTGKTFKVQIPSFDLIYPAKLN